jgi:2,3-bisphosphoglycerate-dependent phosphoglycerate mutase
MKKYIYLFRHAESEFNQKNIFTGWLDPDLTDKGAQQAFKIGLMLKDKQIDLGYCSQLLRSQRTLALALQYHVTVPVVVDKRIAERDYGELSGTSKEEYLAKYGEEALHTVRRSYDVPPPGGESIKMVEARVMPFVEELLVKMKAEKINVAISAHGNSMRPFRKYFEKLTNEEMMKQENPWDDYFTYEVEV